MTTPPTRSTTAMPALIAVLLLASAALFGIGVAVEQATASEPSPVVEAPGHTDEGTETGSEPAGHTDTTVHSERLLGIPVESPWTVALAVVVSLLLAATVWRRPIRAVLIAAALFAAGATVLDIAEISYQVREGRAGIAMLAGLVAALHLAVVAGAGTLLLARGNTPGTRAA